MFDRLASLISDFALEVGTVLGCIYVMQTNSYKLAERTAKAETGRAHIFL